MAYANQHGFLKASPHDLNTIITAAIKVAKTLHPDDGRQHPGERILHFIATNADIRVEHFDQLQTVYGQLFRKKIKLSEDKFSLNGEGDRRLRILKAACDRDGFQYPATNVVKLDDFRRAS